MQPSIEELGDSALLLQFGERIDADLNARVHAAARSVAAMALPGIVELVPGYASLAVVFDPATWQGDDATPAQRCARALRGAFGTASAKADEPTECIEIPVCYGGECGPDLDQAAAHSGLTPQAFAARHAAGDYRVAMLGFAAGFPYLLGLDPALQQPRRANPRTRVAAGSVAIGGLQTGIYPRELPGGWNLIGRTPLALFDAQARPPNRLAAGQRVRFVAIDVDAFNAALR
ncbi:MAG: 5-oxoprolinase subunit PxpB [Rhodanobacteraceae bacterium]|nr:5-oxoprolinase subunit PxpB [Rhodanobacteraceae bacterium]